VQSNTKLSIFYLIANLVALLIFWIAVSYVRQTAKMNDGPDGPDFGDSLNALTYMLPILLLSLLFNIAFGIKALIDVFRRRGYMAITACGVVFLIWFAAMSILRMTG